MLCFHEQSSPAFRFLAYANQQEVCCRGRILPAGSVYLLSLRVPQQTLNRPHKRLSQEYPKLRDHSCCQSWRANQALLNSTHRSLLRISLTLRLCHWSLFAGFGDLISVSSSETAGWTWSPAPIASGYRDEMINNGRRKRVRKTVL